MDTDHSQWSISILPDMSKEVAIEVTGQSYHCTYHLQDVSNRSISRVFYAVLWKVDIL